MNKRFFSAVCSALLLTLLMLLALTLPLAALAEAPVPTDAPAAAPASALAPIPTIGYDWSALAGVAGTAAFTLLVVQFIKAPLDKVWRIPTRLVVYFIALVVLLLGQIFTAGFSLNALALAAVNAVIAASAAMGAYEMTFAKGEKKP